jgi:hypothetical protein
MKMENKDIYEHLAKIYLDTPLRKQQRIKERPGFFKKYVLFLIPLIVVAAAIVVFAFRNKPKNRIINSSIIQLIQNEAIKINFDFDPTKKAIYSFDLNKLSLANFKTLEFALKKSEHRDNVSMRIEFTNSFKEKSEVYIKEVTEKWKDYKISLSDFKGINDWSQMLSLSFSVEEWNAADKKGTIYIDNVKLSR